VVACRIQHGRQTGQAEGAGFLVVDDTMGVEGRSRGEGQSIDEDDRIESTSYPFTMAIDL